MKRSGFNKPSYEEAIAKRRKKRKNKTKLDAEQVWRLAVRAKDDHHCQFTGCPIRYRSIHTHHVAPRARRPDLKYVVGNGKCLCWEHHSWVHMNPKEATAMGLLSIETYEQRDKNV